jgi:hypothetical protein
VEEALVVVLERLGRHRLERVGEPGLGILQEPEPLHGGLAFLLDRGPQPRRFRPHQQPDEAASQDEGNQQWDEGEIHWRKYS